MEYRGVGNRCAVSIDLLRLPIPKNKVLSLLIEQGFAIVDVDIVALARSCLGMPLYRRGARFSEAPATVDCSSFIKWLYAKRGIWLPRWSIQQHEHGEAVELDRVVAEDLIFTSGWLDYYDDNPADGVGHVGIATGNGTVIHASTGGVGVVESPLEKFLERRKFRGARRYIPIHTEVFTFETPLQWEVETGDDIKWIILQLLPT